MTTIVILQPSYLPWLGFFDQMFKSDIFVVYDDVQFDKNGWRNRNRIKTDQGWQWMTVPVLTKGRSKPNNSEILINNATNWQRKHLTAIQVNYSKAPKFDDYFSLFEEAYSREWKYLIDIDMHFIYTLMDCLGLDHDIRFTSKLNIGGAGTERLVKLCLHLGADVFYEGDAGQNYIDGSLFEAEGIQLMYHNYQHPSYDQLHGEFIPYLSVVDLLFNHGTDSLDILVDRNRMPPTTQPSET